MKLFSFPDGLSEHIRLETNKQIFLDNLTPQNFLVYKNHLLTEVEKNYFTTYPLEKEYYYLELIIPLQAESPQGKTSELLQHLSDQATINIHSKS